MELSTARIEHVRVTGEQFVTWLLPVSKTDPRAHGISRSWGCICTQHRDLICPVHRMAHLDMIKTSGSELLFPTVDATI
eukprot:4954893-Amphidinium_carterae.1